MDHVERMRRMFEGGPVDRMVRRPMYYFTQTWERWNREGLPAEVSRGLQALGGWPQALEDIRSAARGDAELFPPILEAVRRGGTLGEICQVFRQVFGEYRDPAYL